MEVRTAKVGDAVDDLFDQAGLTSANSRAADVYTGFGFVNASPLQTFYVKHQGDGYYSIYNSHTKNGTNSRKIVAKKMVQMFFLNLGKEKTTNFS